jgi:A/G-specific adenine glycosylase
MPPTAPAARAALRAAPLVWYDAARRDLPWRTPAGATPDPYRVWLSEVMLQQTRVETVVPYFARWLERFPTLAQLAAAGPDEVMKAWEGLGYYSRARNFHRAAREVVARHGGRVPDDPAAFRALPGVGPYTAGAVLSIAFGRAAPVVDGNVRRVFARWTDAADPPDAGLWAMAERLVHGTRPGDLNQALMELGAIVCTPRRPRCAACPVAAHCAARAAGTQETRPARRTKGPLPHEDTAVAVVEDGAGRVLLVRRPERARLGGMWAFPAAVRVEGETAAAAARRAAAEVAGLEVAPGAEVCTVLHTFTHVRATYRAVRCSPRGGEAPRTLGCDAWSWATWPEVGAYALPTAQRKIAALAAAAERRPTAP